MITTKERPIPYNAEMIRAILARQKTQTRRVIKPQPRGLFAGEVGQQVGWLEWERRYVWRDEAGELTASRKCPYGVPGDNLWARETWRISSLMPDDAPIIQYRADGTELEGYPIDNVWDEDKYIAWHKRQSAHVAADCAKAGIEAGPGGIFHWTIETNPNRWQSSRFIPRWASRILQEVTGMRAERVQDITTRGIEAEGLPLASWCADNVPTDTALALHKEAFVNLWDGINAERGFGFDTNPWVWVVEFRVLEP